MKSSVDYLFNSLDVIYKLEEISESQKNDFADRKRIDLGESTKFLEQHLLENPIYIHDDKNSEDSVYNPEDDWDSNDEDNS